MEININNLNREDLKSECDIFKIDTMRNALVSRSQRFCQQFGTFGVKFE